MNKLNILNWLSRVWHRLLVFIGIRKPGLYEMLNFFSKEGDLGIAQGLGDRLKSILENDEQRKAFLIRIVEVGYFDESKTMATSIDHEIFQQVAIHLAVNFNNPKSRSRTKDDYISMIKDPSNNVSTTEKGVSGAIQVLLGFLDMKKDYIEGNQSNIGEYKDLLVAIKRRVNEVSAVSASPLKPSEDLHAASSTGDEKGQEHIPSVSPN